MSITLLILVAAILFSAHSCKGQEYYVTPTPPPNPACPPDKPCHTLNYYSDNSSFLFTGRENVSLLFLNGLHESSGQSLTIKTVHTLIIAGVNDLFNTDDSQVLIIGISLTTTFTSDITMENIAIHNSSVSWQFLKWLKLQHVIFEHTRMSTFSPEVNGGFINHSKFSFSPLFLLWTFTSTSSTNNSALGILKNTFSLIKTNFFGELDLSTIELTSQYSASIHVNFYNVNVNNQLFLVTLRSVRTALSMEITDSCFMNGINGVLFRLLQANISLTITESTFINNEKAFSISGTGNGTASLEIDNTQFIENINALTIHGAPQLSIEDQSLLLRNVSFIRNRPGSDQSPSLPDCITFIGPLTIIIDSCLFDSNRATSTMVTANANLYFRGNSTFSNNAGVNGGALRMVETTMWLERDTHLSFFNNSASQSGGAILFEDDVASALFYDSFAGYPPCHYQLTFDLPPSLTIPVSMTFENNTAPISGDDIYGVALQSDCTLTPNKQIYSYQVRDKIFKFRSQSLSSVAGTPRRVCHCTKSNLKCIGTDVLEEFSVAVTPGEKFNLSLALVGNDFGMVAGEVFALETDSTFSFSPREELQRKTSRECTNLEYSIRPASETNENVRFVLSTDSISAVSQLTYFSNQRTLSKFKAAEIIYSSRDQIQLILLTAPVFINVAILPCPLGLVFDKKDRLCKCDPTLLVFVHSCIVMNGTGVLYRSGTTWIGAINETDSAILDHKYCSFDYCTPDSVAVDLHNPDTQCALGHSGILCGGCAPGLSLAIGSSRCIPCEDNRGVALLIAFIAAGIALVLLIKILDLTVSQGTINGLIFYANVIWINQGIFFSGVNLEGDRHLINCYYFLRGFIAWLNLDLGIETCFIKGLNAYWKTWLQYTFPLYLWIIAGLIILVCRYSTKATKIFGYNVVPVLGTLFLISYSKLLQTTMFALGPVVLQQHYPTESKWVWLLDGNVPYFVSHHAPLFLVAVFVLVILWLPYTMILLFVGQLNKLSCAKISRLMNKFKPLLDTYTGPLKDKHQYWVGLTLLVRAVLAATAIVFQAVNPTIGVDMVALSSVLLSLLLVRVYRKTQLMLLEVSFLVNLIALSIAFLSTEDAKNRIICTSVSVLVSLLTFAGILVYHAFLVVRRTTGKYFTKKTEVEEETTVKRVPAVPTTTHSYELREPLLDSSPN